MKNTSILIPIILIACLLALALLITKAFSAAKDDAGRTDERIVLNEEDYQSGTPNGEDNFDSYYQEVPENTTQTQDNLAEDPEQPPVTTSELANDRLEEAETTTNNTNSASNASSGNTSYASGRYLVIAGTFRQLANANTRVSDLKRAGFREAEVEKFDRGSFAVALAGRSDNYGEATTMAEKIRTAGFEAKVMRRR